MSAAARRAILCAMAAKKVSMRRGELVAASPDADGAHAALAELAREGLIKSMGRRWVLTAEGIEAAAHIRTATGPAAREAGAGAA